MTCNFCAAEITWKKHSRDLHHLIRLLACCKLEVCTVLVVRKLGQGDLAPEVGCEEGVGFRDLQSS